MDDEATQQQQSPAGAGRGPWEVTIRRSDEGDGVEAAEAAQTLALGPDEGLPSSGRKVWPQPIILDVLKIGCW
jgi:hypothetical protein